MEERFPSVEFLPCINHLSSRQPNQMDSVLFTSCGGVNYSPKGLNTLPWIQRFVNGGAGIQTEAVEEGRLETFTLETANCG